MVSHSDLVAPSASTMHSSSHLPHSLFRHVKNPKWTSCREPAVASITINCVSNLSAMKLIAQGPFLMKLRSKHVFSPCWKNNQARLQRGRGWFSTTDRPAWHQLQSIVIRSKLLCHEVSPILMFHVTRSCCQRIRWVTGIVHQLGQQLHRCEKTCTVRNSAHWAG